MAGADTGGISGMAGDSTQGGRGGLGGQAGGGLAGGGTSGSGGSAGADVGRSAGCGKAPTITSGSNKQIMIGGTSRRYNIRLPDNYDNNRPYRLFIGYHGASLSADIVTNESYYGLLPLSEGTAIFVAPQGLPTGGPFGDGWSNANGADVAFSRQLIAELGSGLCIDTKRIFAGGFSMGGSMAYAMACGAPDLIRAVAVHSGGPMSGCVQHNTPVAYFMTHGTEDGLCTYPEYGVPQLQDFANVNGCTTPDPRLNATSFEAALPNPTNTNGACVDFAGCRPGYPVRSCLFVGDHLWNPGGRSTWVSGEIWNFLEQF
jgi:poly(3-hydroxybutyrate) depolymerase